MPTETNRRVAVFGTRAHLIESDADAIAVAQQFANDLAVNASIHEVDQRLGRDVLDRFSQSGLWAMNVPKTHGGPTLSYATIARVFAIVASVNPSLALVARSHISLIDIIRFDPDDVRKRFLFGAAMSGLRFCNTLSERGGTTILNMTKRPTGDGQHGVLSGLKFQATEALYAHLFPIDAVDDDGKRVLAFVDRDTPGLSLTGDESDFGRRTSDTVTLDHVHVGVERIVPAYLAFDKASVHGAVAQIIDAGIDAGIAHRIIEKTIALVRTHAQPWAHSGRAKASDDPFTIREIADLKVKLHAAEAVLARAGRVIDAGLLEETEETAATASIAVAEAEVLTFEIALQAADKFCELSGVGSVLASQDFDCRWRDVRVDAPRDPLRWKSFAIGDWVVNGKPPARRSWI